MEGFIPDYKSKGGFFMPTTFIKLDRNIVNWRWFKDGKTLLLWIFILLSANISDHGFENIIVHRGELVTSYDSLSKSTGLTVKEIRTALGHLIKTGEVAIRKYPKFSVISVINYNLYQGDGQAKGNQWAVCGQAEGNQRAVQGQQYNNEIIKVYYLSDSNNDYLNSCINDLNHNAKNLDLFFLYTQEEVKWLLNNALWILKNQYQLCLKKYNWDNLSKLTYYWDKKDIKKIKFCFGLINNDE